MSLDVCVWNPRFYFYKKDVEFISTIIIPRMKRRGKLSRCKFCDGVGMGGGLHNLNYNTLVQINSGRLFLVYKPGRNDE